MHGISVKALFEDAISECRISERRDLRMTRRHTSYVMNLLWTVHFLLLSKWKKSHRFQSERALYFRSQAFYMQRTSKTINYARVQNGKHFRNDKIPTSSHTGQVKTHKNQGLFLTAHRRLLSGGCLDWFSMTHTQRHFATSFLSTDVHHR